MSTVAEYIKKRDESLVLAAKIKKALETAINSGQSQSKIDEIENDLTQALVAAGDFQRLADQLKLEEARSPSANAGTTVSNAQTALDDGANSQKPATAPEVLKPDGRIQTNQSTAETNAVPTPTGASTTGTNDPTKTAEQTQSTNPQEPNNVGSLTSSPPVYDPNARQGSIESIVDQNTGQYRVEISGTSGAAAPSDDAAQNNTVQNEINNIFSASQRISPKDNVLDGYASYTYSVSIYLCNKEDYARIISSNDRNISGAQLLFQSAGAPLAVPSAQGPALGRNRFFGNDYYIDNIELATSVLGKGTGSAHNFTTIKFKVTEYNGISLLPNLHAAVMDYVFRTNAKIRQLAETGTDQPSYVSQFYLMVIKFYGYDDQGRLLQGGIQPPDEGGGSANVEKYIPFIIRNITFKVAGRAIEYEWDCAAPQTQIGVGSSYATIPFNIQLAGRTVSDGLAGASRINNQPATNQTPNVAPAPPKANASATVTQGLIDALNQFQEQDVKNGKRRIANKFSIEIVSDAIASAQLSYKADNYSKTQTPMEGSNEPATRLLTEKQAADLNTKTFSAVAGTSVVAFIEKVVRNSTYITDQSLVAVDPLTGVQKPKNTAPRILGWFKISTEVVPIDWDDITNDFAYEVKYVVTPYRLVNSGSSYFPDVPFPGVHKSYKYFFTGENKAVISYEQQYDALYRQVISGNLARLLENNTLTYNQWERRVVQPFSGQSSQGGSTIRSNEVPANFADSLYSISDLSKVSIGIIGDPAWLFQGEASGSYGARQFDPRPFLPDGTINVDYGQIYFDIQFNTPADYNLNGSGLIDPEFDPQDPKEPSQRYTYLARTVTSMLSGGKFTQTLEGVLVTRPVNRANKNTNIKDNRPENAVDPRKDTSNTAPINANQTAQIAGRLNINLQTDAGAGRGGQGGPTYQQLNPISTVTAAVPGNLDSQINDIINLPVIPGKKPIDVVPNQSIVKDRNPG
jgi:hypothetical protein